MGQRMNDKLTKSIKLTIIGHNSVSWKLTDNLINNDVKYKKSLAVFSLNAKLIPSKRFDRKN